MSILRNLPQKHPFLTPSSQDLFHLESLGSLPCPFLWGKGTNGYLTTTSQLLYLSQMIEKVYRKSQSLKVLLWIGNTMTDDKCATHVFHNWPSERFRTRFEKEVTACFSAQQMIYFTNPNTCFFSPPKNLWWHQYVRNSFTVPLMSKSLYHNILK